MERLFSWNEFQKVLNDLCDIPSGRLTALVGFLMLSDARHTDSITFDQDLDYLREARFRKAIDDLVAGWKCHELWITLGLQDVRQRYRRSKLGPFWITLSMGIMVGALGVLYGEIFKQDLHDYLPYLAAGFVVWGLVSAMVTDGCNTFIMAEGMIRQLNAPLSIHMYRQIWSALIALAHNIWIFFITAFVFHTQIGWNLLWFIPALLLTLLNGMWAALFFGVLSARFRDIPMIVASIIQVVFFITPVIWNPSMLPDRALILDLNPFYHMVELLRAPLLGHAPSLMHWLVAGGIAVIGWALALLFYANYRWRIAYWL